MEGVEWAMKWVVQMQRSRHGNETLEIRRLSSSFLNQGTPGGSSRYPCPVCSRCTSQDELYALWILQYR